MHTRQLSKINKENRKAKQLKMAARQKGIEINTIKQKKTEAAKRREEHKVLMSGATSKTVRLKRNINVRYKLGRE